MCHLLQGDLWECMCEATELHIDPFSKDHTNRTKFSLKHNCKIIVQSGNKNLFIFSTT